MRSAEEMVRELVREASGFSMLAIVVAFDETSRFVFYEGDPSKNIAQLRALIKEGGEPIGLLGYSASETAADVKGALYADYEENEWAKPLMQELVESLHNNLKALQHRTGTA